MVSRFFIKRFGLATLGRGEAHTGLGSDWSLPDGQRGDLEVEGPDSDAGREEREALIVNAWEVLAALGGRGNVASVECRITWLWLPVEDLK